MRKLLYIVHSLNVGGTEILVANLAKEFAKDYQVAILALDSIGKIGGDLSNQEISIFCIKRQPGWKLSNFLKLFKVLRDFSPDLIHAHQYTPFFFAAVAKTFLQTKAKIIFTEHGRHYPDKVSVKRQFVNQLLWKQAASVTAVCAFSAKALENKEKYPGKPLVIYNGINVENLPSSINLRKDYNLGADAILVVYLGTFRTVKNPRLLVEAMAIVVKSNPKVFAIMIGDGEQKETLLELIARFSLESNIILLGELLDVSRYWSNFNFFVQPSLSEAHSLALLEAMSQGLPAIVTNVGGAPEVINNNQNGFLVDSEDVQGLAQRILMLAEDLELQKKLGEQAKKDYQEKFTSAVMLDNYKKLYLKLLS